MYKKFFAVFLSGALVWGGLAANVSAAVIDTSDVLALDARKDRIASIEVQLARDDVQHAMTRLGVDPDDARMRVASLSDQELLQLEQELETLPAGGSFFAVVGVVFVILLILEVVGVTNVFKGA